MENNNSRNYYESGADPRTKEIVDRHVARFNDWADKTTNPTRADYVQTSPRHALTVAQGIIDEGYADLAAHKAKRIEGIDNRIAKNRKFSQEVRQTNENRVRNYRLTAQLSSDEDIIRKVAGLRDSKGAAELATVFKDSEELQAYLEVAANRPKLKSATDAIRQAFERSGAQPTDLDRPDVLFDIDERREIESEGPGEIRVTLYNEDGTPKGRMPVRFDALLDRQKLERAFHVKL